MIEVNLFAIPAKEASAKVGRCVARNRFDKESMGVSVEEFVKGFLKDNLEKFEKTGNDLAGIINDSGALSRRDLACLNYYLINTGYILKVFNVTDDEDNPTGVPTGEVVEWNVIDHNFIQNDYPTAVKILPGDGTEVPAILRQIVDQSGVFDKDKFAGLKNPFNSLLEGIDKIKKVSGEVNSSMTSKIYQILDELGIEIFCAISED